MRQTKLNIILPVILIMLNYPVQAQFMKGFVFNYERNYSFDMDEQTIFSMVPLDKEGNQDSKLKMERIHPRNQYFYHDREGTFFASLQEEEQVIERIETKNGSARYHQAIDPDLNIFNDSLVIGELSFISPLSDEGKAHYTFANKATDIDEVLNQQKIKFFDPTGHVSGWIYYTPSGKVDKFGFHYSDKEQSLSIIETFTSDGKDLMHPDQLSYQYEIKHYDFIIQGKTKINFTNFQIGAKVPAEYEQYAYDLETNYNARTSTVKKKRRKRQELYATNTSK